MIKKLSNQELHSRLKTLIASERKTLNLILEHINEVDLRKLYLEMAYSSLYEYLIKECGYSGSAAMRRISAARLLREVPSVKQKIESGDLNLSQVSELSRAIREKERTGEMVSLLKKAEVVESISGKTTERTQKEISQKLDLELKVPEKTQIQKDESVHLSLTLSKEQYEKLLRCKNLGAQKLLKKKDLTLASVIELISDRYLEKKEGQKTNPPPKRFRKESKKKRLNSTQEMRINKTLTPKTRRLILQKDKSCQYRDPATGKTCHGAFHLEVDHKKPRWAGGNHAIENLQVLCRNHNQYKYRKEANLKALPLRP